MRDTLKAAVETVEFAVSDLPGAAGRAQEAPLRASVLMIEADTRLCFISCDTLALMEDTCSRIADSVAERCNLPVDHVLVTSTHTHHAPRAMPVYMSPRDEVLCERIVVAAVSAAESAAQQLVCADAQCGAEMLFSLGQEGTVGANSRWYMDDGQISWSRHDEAKMIRPSGPHDPDLPVVLFRHALGPSIGGFFQHSTHNIGTLADDPASVVSPGFFGLAAQELERQHGAPFLFLPGAFGSSHRRNSHVSGREAFIRTVNAVNDALANLRPMPVPSIRVLKQMHTFRYRQFDEEKEAAAVSRWCRRWFPEAGAEGLERTYREVRASMAHLAGTTFEAPIHVIKFGEVVIVGIPGELFAALALRIRHESPFRHTFLVGLANGEIGYIADRKGYADGGYQTWFCAHSRLGSGEGERVVETVLTMLKSLV